MLSQMVVSAFLDEGERLGTSMSACDRDRFLWRHILPSSVVLTCSSLASLDASARPARVRLLRVRVSPPNSSVLLVPWSTGSWIFGLVAKLRLCSALFAAHLVVALCDVPCV